jgi:hypothetical protein
MTEIKKVQQTTERSEIPSGNSAAKATFNGKVLKWGFGNPQIESHFPQASGFFAKLGDT